MRIINLISSILFLPIGAEAPSLNANHIPPAESLIKAPTEEKPPTTNARTLFEARGNKELTLLASAAGDPERDFTKEKLKKEIKGEPRLYKLYRGAMLRLSNADQIKYVDNHCDRPLKDYRKLFVRYEDDKDESFSGKVCRAYIPPNPNGKPMYILILGHTQKLNDSPDNTGIVSIYDTLVKENRGIVLMFMSGSIFDEAANLSKMESSYTEHKVLFEHMKRNIKDFNNQYNPQYIGIIGFSLGGGIIPDLAKEKNQQWHNQVKATASIDAVKPDKRNLGYESRQRPDFGPDHRHLHIYGEKIKGFHPTEVHGNYPTKIKKNKWGIPIGWERDLREGDIHRSIPNIKHTNIAELPEVQGEVLNHVIKKD